VKGVLRSGDLGVSRVSDSIGGDNILTTLSI
jgi:hypothetical protein